MAANIINGEHAAAEVREKIKQDIQLLMEEKGITPGLAILVVKSPVARVHIAQLKQRTCQNLGIKCRVMKLPETTTDEEIIHLIERLNETAPVHGINIHPLPPHLDHTLISQVVEPDKDVEGLHFSNMGEFLIGEHYMPPFVAKGIIKLIDSTGESIAGKRAVVVGRSQLVGKPVSFMLLERNATVSVVHSQTPDLSEFTKKADILVVAAGHPYTITGEMVKEGSIVIDVGLSQVGTRLVGDVDHAEAQEKASWITPLIGGVGPVTIAMLLDNLVEACKRL